MNTLTLNTLGDATMRLADIAEHMPIMPNILPTQDVLQIAATCLGISVEHISDHPAARDFVQVAPACGSTAAIIYWAQILIDAVIRNSPTFECV